MLCQNCHLNESTIHLYTNVNGQQRQIDLCQNCYQIMKTDPNNAILGGLGGNSQNQPLTQLINQQILSMISLTISVASLHLVAKDFKIPSNTTWWRK